MTGAGWARGSQFVFAQHCKASREVGLTEEQVDAIPSSGPIKLAGDTSWQVADCFAPIERAVLAYTDCLVLQGGRVPDAVFGALRDGLSDEQILELTHITCTYDMHATMSRALRMEDDDVDDPIVEIAAPEGAVLDAMAVVDDLDD